MKDICTVADISKLQGYTNKGSVYNLLKRKILPPPLNPEANRRADYVWKRSEVQDCLEAFTKRRKYQSWYCRKKDHQEKVKEAPEILPIGKEIRKLLQETGISKEGILKSLDLPSANAYKELFLGYQQLKPETAERLVRLLNLFQINKGGYTAEMLVRLFKEQYEANCERNAWLANTDDALSQVGETQLNLMRHLGYKQPVFIKLKKGQITLPPEKKQLFLEFFTSRGWDYEKNQRIEKSAPVTGEAPIVESTKKLTVTENDQLVFENALQNEYERAELHYRELKAAGKGIEAVQAELYLNYVSELIDKNPKIVFGI